MRSLCGYRKHLTDGLPEGKTIDNMNERKNKNNRNNVHDGEFGVDGYTCLPIGRAPNSVPATPLVDDWELDSSAVSTYARGFEASGSGRRSF
jgi:hypothetical protein